MRKFYLILIFVTIITIRCSRESKNTNKDKAESEAVTVKVTKVEQTIISETVKITGDLVPLYQLDIFPKANGIVVSEAVTIGTKVRKDQLLAEIKQDIPGMEFSLVKIEATNDGIITMDAVELGATVSIQRPVYTISQLQQVYMEAKLIESLIDKVKIREATMVEVDAFPQIKFKGEIAEISPVLDRLSRTAEIKILLNNPKLLLKPGMFARAYLTIGEHAGLMVPLDAIVRSGAHRYIFSIKNGRAKQFMVETGVINGNMIEIKSTAVQAGDQIVVLGQSLLEDGSPVSIVEEF